MLTEVLGKFRANGFTVTRFRDENVFLYYLVLAELDDDITTSLIANVLLISSGRLKHPAWTFVNATDRQIRSLGLNLPEGEDPPSIGSACDFPNDLHFRQVLMRSPTPVTMLVGPQHHFSFINPAFVRMIGRTSADDILGRTVREVLPELQGQPFYGLLDNVFRTGKPFVGTEILCHLRDQANGEMHDMYFDFVYHPIHDHNGDVCGILCQASDVTERVLARQVSEAREEQLYRQWAELEAIYRRSPVGLALVDVHDYRLLRFNDMSAELVGLPATEAIGKEFFTLFPEIQGLREIYHRVAAGEEVRNVELDVVHKPDGSPDRRLLLNFSPVLDPCGQIEAIASIAIDLTEYVEPERRLVLDASATTSDLVAS